VQVSEWVLPVLSLCVAAEGLPTVSRSEEGSDRSDPQAQRHTHTHFDFGFLSFQSNSFCVCDFFLGALSHHHGVGYEHLPFMSRYFDAKSLDVLRALKNHLDPKSTLSLSLSLSMSLSVVSFGCDVCV
jgi:hypothetical protein